MPIKAAMWVHGNTAIVESPDKIKDVSRMGWGVRYFSKKDKKNWFHFPFTTPVILDDGRPQLTRVFVFYDTTEAAVTNIHVWDGGRRVREFNELSLEGEHLSAIDDENRWILDPPVTIRYGLSISVGVQFRGRLIGTFGAGQINFSAAGADFEPV
jgi:hypothetical protein